VKERKIIFCCIGAHGIIPWGGTKLTLYSYGLAIIYRYAAMFVEDRLELSYIIEIEIMKLVTKPM